MLQSQKEAKIKELIKEQVHSLKSELSGYKVFLFGSRTDGKSRKNSDFDIGILGNKPLPSHTFYELEDKLENLASLYTFDLVDLARTSEKFRKEALKNVEMLYG